MMVHLGATRLVILAGRWAIKLPRPWPWRLFLFGLLANMQEREFARAGWPELCPLAWSVPGGFLLVMHAARPLTNDEWERLDPVMWRDQPNYYVPVEAKRDSFGVFRGRIVAVDYGS